MAAVSQDKTTQFDEAPTKGFPPPKGTNYPKPKTSTEILQLVAISVGVLIAPVVIWTLFNWIKKMLRKSKTPTP